MNVVKNILSSEQFLILSWCITSQTSWNRKSLSDYNSRNNLGNNICNPIIQMGKGKELDITF